MNRSVCVRIRIGARIAHGPPSRKALTPDAQPTTARRWFTWPKRNGLVDVEDVNLAEQPKLLPAEDLAGEGRIVHR